MKPATLSKSNVDTAAIPHKVLEMSTSIAYMDVEDVEWKASPSLALLA